MKSGRHIEPSTLKRDCACVRDTPSYRPVSSDATIVGAEVRSQNPVNLPSVDLPKDEIEYVKKIGYVDGCPLVEMGLIGGLHTVFIQRAKSMEPMGAGTHPAVARYMAVQKAKKNKQKLELTELTKGDYVDPAHFQSVLPHYEANLQHYAARVATAYLNSLKK
jgi:hypothetical protein